MSAVSNVQGIANFITETAVVDGVRLHYWIGGDPKGVPVLLWHGYLLHVPPSIFTCASSQSAQVPDARDFDLNSLLEERGELPAN